MNDKWNAQKYTDDFSFVPRYGSELIDLIDSQKGSTVLDLGCGNGELTDLLNKTGYKAFGIDSSVDLLDVAKKRYPNIEFWQGDATNFSLSKPVEVVFSNAVFHWIKRDKHKDMLSCIFKALKPHGELIFECGGFANNKLIHAALKKSFEKYGYIYEMPFYFPTIAEYASLLEENGFLVVYAKLFERETKLKGENGLKDWIDMFVRSPFNVIQDEQVREMIKEETVSDLREHLYKNKSWYADYVRLRMKAIRI